MVSRMDKYYNGNTNNIKKRSQKNQDLYRNIYDMGEYSNIEAVATLEKNNEIDITKIKDMLKDRESYKKQKQYRQILNKEEKKEPEISDEFVQKKEEKIYDIRDVLNKAKNNKTEEKTFRSLDNTNYNILKNLELNNQKGYESEEDELKELINTITSTSMLHQMDDEELGLNILDLAETKQINDNNKSIKALLEEAKQQDDKKQKKEPVIDDSFYTSSLNFSKEDFEEADRVVNKKSKKKIIKILLIMFLIIITGLIIFVVYNLIK